MNFVFLSPHFPPNYYHFCEQLRFLDVNVLGLADEPYDLLQPHLKNALTEYYLVNNMHNYDELLRGLGYFTHRYGKIDRIDSQNEYWLETEAQLRTDFNIPGIKNDLIGKVKRKSLMKETFINAGVPAARGRVMDTLAQAQEFIEEVGFPIVAKPDIGVGAAKTYKITTRDQLEEFFAEKTDVEYIMEEYIDGEICTFDGLTDQNGNLVFSSSLKYSQGVMETVNQDGLIYYYIQREIPPSVEEIGRRVLKAFDIRERFFHFEFFQTPGDKIVALEVNIRPPGGLTTDMMNYANDIDVYKEWAHIIVHNRFTADVTRKYFCAYIGRKFNRVYLHPHEEILRQFGEKIVHHEQINGIFSAALGDYGYLLRSPDLEDVFAGAEFIQQLA